VDTKQFLSDVIPNTGGSMGWSFDNKSIMYIWIKSADNNDPNGRLNPKTKLHTLGTAYEADMDLFSGGKYPALNIAAKSYPSVFLTKDAPEYIFGREYTVQKELALFYAPISQFNSEKIEWKTLCKTSDKLIGRAILDGKMYAITYKNAKNYKLVATDLANPDWDNATTIVAEKDMSLQSAIACKDYVLLEYNDGINSQLYKYNPKTKATNKVELPLSGTATVQILEAKTNEYLVQITSWNKPATEFLYNAETDAFTNSEFNQAPVYPAEYKDLVVEEVEVKGHDGVMVPLSIFYKKGIKKDGSNVCFMESYGAYGASETPYFNPRYAALAIKGVIIAVPHVRGGSEKGEDWYKAGFKTTKPNTWKDFISCADYLIAQGYTTSAKLGGTGTSAGGILISRAITERPHLFAAAICNVGCANALRLEFSANGTMGISYDKTLDGEQTQVMLTNIKNDLAAGGIGIGVFIGYVPGAKSVAILKEAVPKDIITSPQGNQRITSYYGIAAGKFDELQKTLLKLLIEEYTHNFEHQKAHQLTEKIMKSGIENIYFAWIGSLENNKPHYYIIHGPDFLIEYDNVGFQNDGNHIHAILREKGNDFGNEALMN
jgi:prolyl oligopeptidase